MFKRPEVAVMLTACLALAGAVMNVKAAVIDGAPPAKASPGGPTAPRFHLRCWQNGRLLFEQAVAALPADAGHSTRLQSKDGAQDPVIVYETRNATCLARGLRSTR